MLAETWRNAVRQRGLFRTLAAAAYPGDLCNDMCLVCERDDFRGSAVPHAYRKFRVPAVGGRRRGRKGGRAPLEPRRRDMLLEDVTARTFERALWQFEGFAMVRGGGSVSEVVGRCRVVA